MKFFLCRLISDSQLLQKNDRVSLVKRYNLFIDVSFIMLIYSYGCNHIKVQHCYNSLLVGIFRFTICRRCFTIKFRTLKIVQ